ncbi:FtsQ-type POTRA domain-containing protein [Modestobacter sp. I12A-02628]|uniref:FtsQ-type POTRA domain-containing protein n=1 Tax=Goekera deserti TaxID=2497753 RepID=A0A7K3WAD0_9ACTN|nr:FtsQ-type POTRA domain-containing protein [Goekera deserti]NDI47607.1 FtsQ-type POTRA domain-containing protein [Goekera deserti]NDI47670.1 FtsQ-type POTRA domain-containing protein [Goekera deserti]NEL53418.1 FtsQ-type POTRA domain-containing protein [Goekera deserti]
MVAGVTTWLVLASPLLSVRGVAVDGARTLTAEEVRTAAGVTPGQALLRVDTDAVAARVAALPPVASVEVVRGWPDSVVITLTERLPVAVVEQDGVRSLVDRTGTLYDTVTGPAPDGVVPLDVPSPGTGDRATRAAVQVLTTLPDPVRASVTDVVATGADDVTLTLTGGRTVLWGGQGDPERKARVLAALLAQIEAGTLEPASTIDVSVPDSVVLR